MQKFFNNLSNVVNNISDISNDVQQNGIDEVGNDLNIGKTKNIILPIHYYIEKLGYDPSRPEEELPEELGNLGQRKEEALRQAKIIENYYRIIQYINDDINEILG